MTTRNAQMVLVVFALGAMFLCILIFLTGRSWGLPFDYQSQEHVPFVQMLIPPFITLLGLAIAYVGKPSAPDPIPDEKKRLLAVLVYGPTVLFALSFVAATYSFYSANQPGSVTYFTLGEYRTWMTILVSFLTASTVALANVVFKAGGN